MLELLECTYKVKRESRCRSLVFYDCSPPPQETEAERRQSLQDLLRERIERAEQRAEVLTDKNAQLASQFSIWGFMDSYGSI